MNLLIRIYSRHFLLAELVLSILLAFGAARLHVLKYLPGNTDTIYVALSASFGALLGFAITGVSVMLAVSDSERLALLRTSPHYPLVFRIFTSAARYLGVGFLTAFLGLVLDRQTALGQAVAYLTLFSVIISVFRVYRCVWVLDSVITIVTRLN